MRKRISDQYQIAAHLVRNVRGGRAASRRDLATVLGLSPSTVGLYVDQMIRIGFLAEAGCEQGEMGRPKRILVTSDKAGWFAGIEFHAGRVRGVRIDFGGKKLRSEEHQLNLGDGPEEVVNAICGLVEKLRGENSETLIGVGVGAPGVVNPETGVAGNYAFLPGWEEVPLRWLLERRLGVPAWLEGNLRVIARGEQWFGAGQAISHFAILGARSGVGVAAVHGGVLFKGLNHAAGEVGNWQWTLDGQAVELHEALSAPSVWRRLAGVSVDHPVPTDLEAAIAELAGNQSGPALEAVRADFAKLVGSLELILDCGTYFVHGPLAQLGDAFWEGVASEVLIVMPHLRGRPPTIKSSQLGEDAGALGAACMAMESWQPIW